MTRNLTRMGAAGWMLAYVVVVGATLLAWNAAGGGMIEHWYSEYVGADGRLSGSGAWRGLERERFQLFAMLLGTWVYPISVISALAFARRAWGAPTSQQRWGSAACVVVALAMLGCFLRLGVLGAVTRF